MAQPHCILQKVTLQSLQGLRVERWMGEVQGLSGQWLRSADVVGDIIHFQNHVYGVLQRL